MTIHPVQQPDGPEPLRCIADTIAKGKAKTNGTISGAAIPVLERDAILGVSTSTKPNAARALRTMQDRARNKLMH